MVELDWDAPIPAPFAVARRVERKLAHRRRTRSLNLRINSTGIKAEGKSEWNARKHAGTKRRVWRKIHIGIDEETLEVRTIEVTSSNVRDVPMLSELLNQIPSDQGIGSVTADGACDKRKCHDAIAARGFHVIIPPRKSAKLWKPMRIGAIACKDAIHAL